VERFVALDSWRGIAACLVALFHLNAYSHLYEVPFLRNSWLFVDFFFVLSGFIIAANYQQRLVDGFGVGRFLLLRLGRLYPLHLAMLALFVAWELLKVLRGILTPELASINPVAPFSAPQNAPNTILANLLLIHGLHLYDFLTWNFVSWSISTEFYTYAIFAACLIGLRKHAWIALVLAMIGGPILIAILSERNMGADYDWGMIRCLYGFAAGVACWNIHRSWSGKLKKWLSGSMVEWGALGLVVVFVSTAGASLLSIAAPYVFALVVLVFAFDAGTASAILRLRPLVFLGTISYSIYMTHVFIASRMFDVGYQLDRRLHSNPFTYREMDGWRLELLGTQLWQGDIAYAVYLAMIIAMSCLAYRWIEKPGREWVRDRLRRRQRGAVPAALKRQTDMDRHMDRLPLNQEKP
jgi:peptidoglycan/LPS O-acetylase OafA/YrhL